MLSPVGMFAPFTTHTHPRPEASPAPALPRPLSPAQMLANPGLLQVGYGATILSFLGGVHWGLAMTNVGGERCWPGDSAGGACPPAAFEPGRATQGWDSQVPSSCPTVAVACSFRGALMGLIWPGSEDAPERQARLQRNEAAAPSSQLSAMSSCCAVRAPSGACCLLPR